MYLRNSVIPFINLYDFKKEFFPKVTRLVQDHEQHQKDIQALKLLELKEKQFNENINLINNLRRVILYRYSSK